MTGQKKLIGEDRRSLLLQMLKETEKKGACPLVC